MTFEAKLETEAKNEQAVNEEGLAFDTVFAVFDH